MDVVLCAARGQMPLNVFPRATHHESRLLLCVFNCAVHLQNLDRCLVNFWILTLFIQQVYERIALPSIEVAVNHHQAAFALLNVLAVAAPLLAVLFAGYGDYVVLYLERGAQSIGEQH